MKRLFLATTVIALMGCASTALAQRTGGGGAASLLSIAEVQKELNITDAQKEKLQDLRGKIGDVQNLSREERQKKFEELAKKTGETIKTVLDERQQKRLAELRIQHDGAGSLARAEVAEQVGLEQAQKDQIKKIQTENTPTNRPNFQNATQEERQKFLTESRDRREKTHAAILGVLTPAQKEAFEKMQGAKFTFPPQRRAQ